MVVLDLESLDPLGEADVRPEPVGVADQVVDDFVAGRVALTVAGKRSPRQAREASRREQLKALVVGRPGPGRQVRGFEDDGVEPGLASGEGGGEPGLATADDD